MAAHFSFDTENGGESVGEYQTKKGVTFRCGIGMKNRVITYARVGVRHLDDVRCLVSEKNEDVYQMFYDRLVNSEPETSFVFHVWNLGWEWKPIMHWFAREYVPEAGWEYESVVTINNVYSLKITTPEITMTFVDDNNHYHTSVKNATVDLKKIGKYAKIMSDAGIEGKESNLVEEMHEIWYSKGRGSVEWDTYVHYARVDAFCQALLCEHLFDEGRFCTPGCFDGITAECMSSERTALSASGAGFRDAKSVLVYGCDYKDIPTVLSNKIKALADRKFKGEFDKACAAYMGKYLDEKWTDKFGLLTMEDQMIVETNLRGGLVYGKPGVYVGHFYHYDYKSSYPFEYAYCKLPVGSGFRTVTTENGKEMKIRDCVKKTNNPNEMNKWIEMGSKPNVQVFIKGRVMGFKLKDGAIPFITVKDCVDESGLSIKSYGLDRAKKMKAGNTGEKLWTYEEWKLLDRCYDVEWYDVKEVWMTKAEIGFYEPAIRKYFDKKESTTGSTKALAKLDLNGATHGRAMMKVLTADVIEMGVDAKLRTAGKRYTMDNAEHEIKTNPLIGLTAMSHARCRLIEHCMILIENGYQIYMNDTDSLVTDCPPEEMKRLLNANGWKDWIIEDGVKEMSKTLGRFSIEDMKIDGVKVKEFQEFRCWGLKRYAEIVYTDELKENGWVENGKNCLLRKSAFAGMHEEDQRRLLGDTYRESFEWESSSKKWVDECYTIRMHDVCAGKEEIYYEG